MLIWKYLINKTARSPRPGVCFFFRSIDNLETSHHDTMEIILSPATVSIRPLKSFPACAVVGFVNIKGWKCNLYALLPQGLHCKKIVKHSRKSCLPRL